MDRYPLAPAGFSLATLIDQEIAHIGRVMRPSMHGDLAGAILPASYWRKRLHELLAVDHLTKTQLATIDGLLLQLEQLDSSELEPLPVTSAPFSVVRPTHRTRPLRRR
jgi:hypothetical protein